MRVKETRAAILRDWFALPPDQRATAKQATQFAERAQIYYNMPANDNVGVIKAWLTRYIGLNPL